MLSSNVRDYAQVLVGGDHFQGNRKQQKKIKKKYV